MADYRGIEDEAVFYLVEKEQNIIVLVPPLLGDLKVLFLAFYLARPLHSERCCQVIP